MSPLSLLFPSPARDDGLRQCRVLQNLPSFLFKPQKTSGGVQRAGNAAEAEADNEPAAGAASGQAGNAADLSYHPHKPDLSYHPAAVVPSPADEEDEVRASNRQTCRHTCSLTAKAAAAARACSLLVTSALKVLLDAAAVDHRHTHDHEGEPHEGEPHEGEPHEGEPHEGEPHEAHELRCLSRCVGRCGVLVNVVASEAGRPVDCGEAAPGGSRPEGDNVALLWSMHTGLLPN